MRFVSEVASNNGRVHCIGRLNTSINGFVSAVATEDGVDTKVIALSDLDERTIGFCKEHGILVSYTTKEAMLHDYVSVADTVDSKPGFDFSGMDSASLASGTAVIAGEDTIAIDTYDMYIRISGERGSVVSWQSGSGTGYQYITLYEALGRVCRELGINLFSYKRIFLFSQRRNYFSQVDLVHNQESDRYFIKMFLDVN